MRLTNLLSLSILALSSFVNGIDQEEIDNEINSNLKIYELNKINKHNKIPLISVDSSLYYFADKLDVSNYYKLSELSHESIEAIDDIYSSLKINEENDKQLPKLIIKIDGIDQQDSQFNKLNLNPTFVTKNNEQSYNFADKITENFKNFKLYKLTNELQLISNNDNDSIKNVLINHYKYYDEKLIKIWQNFKSLIKNTDDNQIILNNNNKDDLSHINVINEKLFINELSQLIHLDNVEETNDEDIIYFNSKSLFMIDYKIGKDSTTYKFCQKLLIDYLIKLTEKFEITVIASNTKKSNDKQRNILNKRNQELNEIFQTYNKRSSSQSLSNCYTNEESCQVSTSNCNSHGVCSKVDSGCWQCLCSASYNKSTSKTTNWSGFDCGKKDISAQAHLLLWTSIGLLVAFAGGIKLLISVGSESLPGVLDAATTSSSKKA